jgi:hypothetical protein
MSTSTISAERHNAYGWVRPDAATCYLCGKKEYITPVDGFQVQDCDECSRPICEQCAEVDYDGDSEGFRNTQWQCEKGCTPPEPEPHTHQWQKVPVSERTDICRYACAMYRCADVECGEERYA